MGTNDEEEEFGQDVILKPLSVHPDEYVSLETVQYWYKILSRVLIRDVDYMHYKQLERMASYPEGTIFEFYSTSPQKKGETK